MAKTLYGLQQFMYSKDTSGTANIQLMLRLSSVDHNGASQAQLNGTYDYFLEMWQTDPQASGEWTETNVNAMEAGYEDA